MLSKIIEEKGRLSGLKELTLVCEEDMGYTYYSQLGTLPNLFPTLLSLRVSVRVFKNPHPFYEQLREDDGEDDCQMYTCCNSTQKCADCWAVVDILKPMKEAIHLPSNSSFW